MFGNATFQPTIISMNSTLYPPKYDQIVENIGQMYLSACIGVYVILVKSIKVNTTITCIANPRCGKVALKRVRKRGTNIAIVVGLKKLINIYETTRIAKLKTDV